VVYEWGGELEAPKQTKTAKQELICADCGKPIYDGKKRDGSAWKASDIAAYTKVKYGRALCVDCGKKATA